jgi:NAD(P)-dependent dehydrogenase (short-subunit alcohol dehydrogenase family)
MIQSFDNKTVLITGGTKGIGLATGIAFGRLGATTVLTYRWGSADESEINAAFTAAGAKAPLLIQADVAEAEDTAALLQEVKATSGAVDVFISNVAGSVVVPDFEGMTERALLKSIQYSSWPTFAYMQQIRKVFGRYPRYVVATSSPGPDSFNPGYEFVAASKAVLETLVRYASYRLRDDNVNINVVRAAALDTQSTRDMFGSELFDFLERLAPPGFKWLKPEEVASVIVALCSGLLDGVKGQVLTVDQGMLFSDDLMRLYAQREALAL